MFDIIFEALSLDFGIKKHYQIEDVSSVFFQR